jgi:hypothetical protein
MAETEMARKAMRTQAAVQCMTTILTALRSSGVVIKRATGAIPDNASSLLSAERGLGTDAGLRGKRATHVPSPGTGSTRTPLRP